jgi:hypothetical protein
MRKIYTSHRHPMQIAIITAFLTLPGLAAAADYSIETAISRVAVNGGADTVNPGTTCIQITTATSAACPGGFLYIPNNNKNLVAAALLNKTIASKSWLYYRDTAAIGHCPGLVFTPCSVISIGN